MKLMHLSDLHLGLWLHRFPLQEEQTEMLERIRQIAQEERPDAVLIAGDVYDRAVPPEYALTMFDTFLTALRAMSIPVFICSGNHDSAERVGFLSRALETGGVYVSPAYRGQASPIVLHDAEGPVHVRLLPYLKAATVRRFFPEEEINTTNEAVCAAIRHMDIDKSVRNVLVCHQFVAGAALSGSEESLQYTQDISVGGSDLVDASAFRDFDYVALGHIHRAQNITGRIRYCGTPMACSYSEIGQEKSATLVEMDGDGNVHIRTVAIPCPRRLQEVRGTYAEITGAANLAVTDRDAYTHVTLTDDAAVTNIMDGLRQVYPRLTHVDWDTARTRRQTEATGAADREHVTPMGLFDAFFRQMGGDALSGEQEAYLQEAIEGVWGDMT